MGALLVGFVFFIVGITGVIFVKRRQFYRRNAAGNEEFESYGHMVRAGFLELAMQLVSWPLLIVGLIMVLTAGFGRP